MIDKVVDLIVTVDQGTSILRLCFGILEELYYIFIVRSCANGVLGLDVDHSGLCRGDGAEGLDLAAVEARRLAKSRETDSRWRNAVKLCKRHDSILPPIRGEDGRKVEKTFD